MVTMSLEFLLPSSILLTKYLIKLLISAQKYEIYNKQTMSYPLDEKATPTKLCNIKLFVFYESMFIELLSTTNLNYDTYN